MNGLLTIDPVFPLWIIAILLIPAFVFFIWKEIRNNQRFATLRVTAQLLVLISILGIVMRVSFNRKIVSPGILLLTEGYRKETADSLLTKYPALKIVRTPGASSFENSEELANNYAISEFGDKIRFIAGEGLSPDQLALIPERNFEFISGKMPKGITSILVDHPVYVNHSNKITGIVNYTGKSSILKVTGSGIEDSINLEGKGVTPFSFTIRPKQAGTFLFSLQSKDTSFINEKLPIEILSEQKLTILFLQKFPTAETRYLKNFLAEQGHKISLRYQTSKTNFNYEYANTSSNKVGRITPDIAQALDLLFIDSSVLSELSATETTILKDAIHNGLGVILLDLPEKERILDKFVSFTFKPVKVDTVHLRLGSAKEYALPIHAVSISSSQLIEPILTHRDKILSGFGSKGAGKIAFQLLRETYRVRLEGNTDDYAFIWTTLIDRVARTKDREFKMSLTNSFPYYQDQTLGVEIISAGQPPSLFDESIQLPVEEDVIIDDLWHSKTWASVPGWHALSIKEDSTQLNYFVSERKEWNALRSMNNRSATALVESNKEIRSVESIRNEAEEVPPLIFFLLFIFASGFLWLAPKI